MKLVCISRVKNEVDIIEAFVRHHLAYFDKLIIADDCSSDGTYEVLRALREEGLPLVLLRQATVGYEQSRHMTRLMRMAVDQFGADWVMPLDADEFIEPKEGTTVAKFLAPREARLIKLRWNNFVWCPEQDASPELNPVIRLRARLPPRDDLNKVLVPARLVTDGVWLSQGNHDLARDGELLTAEMVDDVQLCHFPIRSVPQFASKVVIGYLQYSAMPYWDRKDGFQFQEPFRQLANGVERLASHMEAYSRSYSLNDDQGLNLQSIEAPLRYAGTPLTLTPPRRDRLLANILDCAETIALGLADTSRRNAREIARLRGKLERLIADRDTSTAEAQRGNAKTRFLLDKVRHSTSWRRFMMWFAPYLKSLGARD